MDEPKERLVIENFAGIRFLEIDVHPFTIIIGPQSVGKSVTAKLLYFFQNITPFLEDAVLNENPPAPKNTLLAKFAQFFPSSNYSERKCSVSYQQGSHSVSLSRSKTGGWVIILPDAVEEAFSVFIKQSNTVAQAKSAKPRSTNHDESAEIEYAQALDSIFPNSFVGSQFVPAGRSFYAQIRDNMASFLMRASLDAFVTEFGIFIDSIKRQNQKSVLTEAPLAREARALCDRLLSGQYVREGGEDFIDVTDGRRLPAALWSSGQQEAQPLTAILLHFCEDPVAARTLFIEEPEAHLFPSAQKIMTELIALAFHADSPYSRMFITTHSPYILTTINNLLLAGQLHAADLTPKLKRSSAKIVPVNCALEPGSVGAYFMNQDGCRPIIDGDTRLIEADAIDEVSNDLNEAFEKLLNLRHHS